MPLLIDSNESYEHEAALRACVPVERVPLNVHNYADYLWYDWNNLRIQVEHKQIGEILGGLNHVEEQLSRQLPMADRNYLCWTGEFEPVSNNSCQEFRSHGKVYVPGKIYRSSFTGVMAWFDQLDQCGVTVAHVSNEKDLAMWLVAMYQSHQVSPDGHHTLKRYIKDKIQTESKNPHVHALLAIGKTNRCGLGEDAAIALVDRFCTLWQIANQEPASLAQTDGVSLNVAKKLLTALGRAI
jgi:hypothetical protein